MNRKREEGREKDGGMGGEVKKGDFQKFEILTASTPLQCQLAPPCQISCRSVNAVPQIWPFIEFSKMAAVRLLGFSKVGNFNCPYPL